MSAPGRTPRAPLAGVMISVGAGWAATAVQPAAFNAATDSPTANANTLRRPADSDPPRRTAARLRPPIVLPGRYVPPLDRHHAAHNATFTQTALPSAPTKGNGATFAAGTSPDLLRELIREFAKMMDADERWRAMPATARSRQSGLTRATAAGAGNRPGSDGCGAVCRRRLRRQHQPADLRRAVAAARASRSTCCWSIRSTRHTHSLRDLVTLLTLERHGRRTVTGLYARVAAPPRLGHRDLAQLENRSARQTITDRLGPLKIKRTHSSSRPTGLADGVGWARTVTDRDLNRNPPHSPNCRYDPQPGCLRGCQHCALSGNSARCYAWPSVGECGQVPA